MGLGSMFTWMAQNITGNEMMISSMDKEQRPGQMDLSTRVNMFVGRNMDRGSLSGLMARDTRASLRITTSKAAESTNGRTEKNM